MANPITPGNSQNVATPKRVKTSSKFKLDYHVFDTFRFGELHPHFVMECVRGDKNVQVRSEHNLRTYSLSAPLMQKIRLKKDYFAVPMEAILPFNWEKIFENPIIGDDVPDDAGTYVSDFRTLIDTFLENIKPANVTASDTDANVFASTWTSILRYLLTAELFYSSGNLMSSLGIHLSHIRKFQFLVGQVIKNAESGSFDSFFDAVVEEMISQGSGRIAYFYVSADSESSRVRLNWNAIDIRTGLDLMRDNLGTFEFSVVLNSNPIHINAMSFSSTTIGDGTPFGLNLARLFAYQIVCAHFYTNDHVDYIYTADLYRQYIGNLLKEIMSDDYVTFGQDAYFDYNSVSTPYDYLSARYFYLAVTFLTDSTPPISLAFLQAIFGYKHSLRYVDYFVGARTSPLAVGDVNVAVSGGQFSVVDTTIKTQLQRFLNAVNRGHRTFSKYLENIFPSSERVAPDYHNPFFIGHTMDEIYGQEVENTGEAQQSNGNSVTAVLRSNASRFAFEFDADRPCIILGISYFDIPRAYWESIERQNFHKDRFDMFNPFMQFIGDQQVYIRELSPSHDTYNLHTFGYQLRYAEYKQRYNQAQGGFVEYLPGYAFLNDYGFTPNQSRVTYNIGPSFIRSYPTELDRFYLSLTGFSLGSYFHFIVDNYNDVSASRPMVYAPSIL